MHPIEQWVQYQDHLATEHIKDSTDNHIMMISRSKINFTDEQNAILDKHGYKSTIWISTRFYNNRNFKMILYENPQNIYFGTKLEEVIKFNVTCVVDCCFI
jgi:hypothetical protein